METFNLRKNVRLSAVTYAVSVFSRDEATLFIRGCVRPPVGRFVRPSVRPSVRPLVGDAYALCLLGATYGRVSGLVFW